MFKVQPILNNSRTQQIGWQVVCKSAAHGTRYGFSRMGQHESSLSRAKAECQTEADRLNAEAKANRERSA